MMTQLVQVGNGSKTCFEPTSVLLQSLRRGTWKCFGLSQSGLKLTSELKLVENSNQSLMAKILLRTMVQTTLFTAIASIFQIDKVKRTTHICERPMNVE